MYTNVNRCFFAIICEIQSKSSFDVYSTTGIKKEERINRPNFKIISCKTLIINDLYVLFTFVYSK